MFFLFDVSSVLVDPSSTRRPSVDFVLVFFEVILVIIKCILWRIQTVGGTSPSRPGSCQLMQFRDPLQLLLLSLLFLLHPEKSKVNENNN